MNAPVTIQSSYRGRLRDNNVPYEPADHPVQQPLTLGLEVSDAAAEAMRRDGWLDLGMLPLFVRPLLPSRMLSQRLRARAHKRAALLADFPVRVADAGVHMLLWRSTYRLRRVEAFDERLDHLFLRLSRRYPIMARRDRAVMHWRFLRHPDADRYALYQLERGGELTGVAVTRLALHNGVPTGHIVDYLCAPEHLRPLLARVLPVLRARGAAAVSCAQSWAGAARAFASFGFLRRSTGFRMMMRVADDAGLDVGLFADRRSWFVTLGDANLGRSRDRVVFA